MNFENTENVKRLMIKNEIYKNIEIVKGLKSIYIFYKMFVKEWKYWN